MLHFRSPVSRGAEKSLPETNFDRSPSAPMMHAFHEPGTAPPRTLVASGEDDDGPLPVLVVEPELDELLMLTSMLSAAGFHVTAAGSFVQARALIGGARTFGLLLTALRLGMFNGLHLVVRGQSVQPQMAALVTASPEDAMLRTEAENLGATFVIKPTTSQECIAAILQTVFRQDTSTPIRPPFERRRTERRREDLTSSRRRTPAQRSTAQDSLADRASLAE